MPPKRNLIALALASLLSSCGGGATPYQYDGLFYSVPGGHSERDLGNGTWRVVFTATPATTRESLQTYWLYRCAELTLEKGYDGFEVISDTRLSTHPTDVSTIRLAASHPVFIPMPMGHGGGDPLPFHFGGDIKLLKGLFVPQKGHLFDAAILKAALAPHVLGAKCDKNNVCPHSHSYLE